MLFTMHVAQVPAWISPECECSGSLGWQWQVSGVLAERGQLFFLGRSEMDDWRERQISTLHMQGRLAAGTYLSGALPQYIPGRSKRVLRQACFDAKRKGREKQT